VLVARVGKVADGKNLTKCLSNRAEIFFCVSFKFECCYIIELPDIRVESLCIFCIADDGLHLGTHKHMMWDKTNCIVTFRFGN